MKSHKPRKPQNIIKRILAERLIRTDFKDAMKYVNALVRSGDAWKYNYHQVKSILSRTLRQDIYSDAVKQLNIIVRPYREKQ